MQISELSDEIFPVARPPLCFGLIFEEKQSKSPAVYAETLSKSVRTTEDPAVWLAY
jgi:hypothetical protein